MGTDAGNEMERIHRGLEEFLEQELKVAEQQQRQKEPKLFTIEEPRKEKEIDVIGGTGRGADSRPRKGGSTGRSKSSHPAGNRTGNRDGTTRPAGSAAVQPGPDRNPPGKRSRARPAAPDVIFVDNSRKSRKGTRPGKFQESKEPVRRKRKNIEKNQGRKNRANGADDTNGKSVSAGSGRKGGSGKRPLLSRVKRFLVVAVLILALLGVGLYQLVGMVYHKMHYSEIPSQTKLPMEQEGTVNILLIGNDSRQNGEDGRSDAMILLSVSRRTRKITMISLLRDIYVEIPGHDNNRLNAAYSFGGAELLMETIEKNFDIPVHRYVQVNFEAFANLLDAVGGVDLELSREEIEYVNGYLVEYNMLTNRPQGTDNMDPSVSGMVHLNGPQALAYCRNRYLGTDFGRTERQRKVMTEVIRKLPGAVLTNFGELTDGLLPNLTTNLTQWECFRLSLMAGKLLTYDLESDSVPQPGTYKSSTIRKMSVLEVDFEANRNYLKEKLYGK